MTDSAPLPASEALSSPPDLPTPTPGAAPAAPAPADPAPAASPVDSKPPAAPDGWDPSVHENPPRRNAQGAWARLRGNAARKAKGLPMIGATAGMKPRPVTAPAAPLAAPASPPASPSVLVLPPAGQTPGAAGAEVDGEPAPAATGFPVDAYEATASAITGGSFGILSMLLGKAWNPAPQESQAWRDAWRRVFFHYQWRPLGPLVEVIMLACTSVAKRRDDPETRATVAGWFRRKPAPERQAAPPEPRDAAAPAEPPPAPGDAAAVPVKKLAGWI